jgi:BirA family biotin operon repressor/biotin-[acetyl-CoA-carboxylase] ligase
MQLFYFDSVDSTNDEVVKLLNCGTKPIFCAVANVQTSGRGRRGNHWLSQDPGNIYFSAALPTQRFPQNSIGVFPQIFILSLFLELKKTVHLSVKWPNDIFLAGKKVGGVLLETRFAGGVPERAVLGVGINISTAPNSSSIPDAAYEATALGVHLPSITRQFVLDSIIRAVEKAVDLCERNGHANFIADHWKNFDMLQSRRVSVDFAGEIFSGNAAGVDTSGRLILRLGGGERLCFDSAKAKIIL